jgi:hypothetical protein
MRVLLWFVKEHFGMCWSKHNKENVVIKIEKP